MPAGESPLISPGVPQVPFVTVPYEPVFMEVVIFGQGLFHCGRSLPLEGVSTVWNHKCQGRVCSPRGHLILG